MVTCYQLFIYFLVLFFFGGLPGNAGLAAYIFTNNVQRSWRVTEALEYGLVGVNEGLISTEVGFSLKSFTL